MLGAGFIGATRRRTVRRLINGFAVTLTGVSDGQVPDGATLGYDETSPATPQAQRWQTSADGLSWSDIPAATHPTLLVDFDAGALRDTDLVRVGVTIDAAERFSGAVRLVQVAPSVLGQLPGQSFTHQSGTQTLQTASAFAGRDLTFAVIGPTGVDIDGASGQVTFDTAVLAPQTGTGLTVTATNSGGTVSQELAFSIVEDLSVALTGYTDGAEPVVDTGTEDGPLTWVVADGPYAGSYGSDHLGGALSISDGALHIGGVAVPDGAAACLVAPVVTAGDPWTLTPGYWLYGGSTPAGPDFAWQRDGLGISGATALTYSPVPADDGATLTASETFGITTVQATQAAPALRASQSVIVPAGRVGSDLTGFPLRIALSDMSPAWWAEVAADGGNIRATDAAGSQTFPMDIAWIDTMARQGTLYVKRSLAAASDTETVLHVRDPAGASLPAPTDPIGRHAVWADYLRVTAFPSMTDRTGTADPSVAGVTLPAASTTFVDAQVSGDIGMHQGMCWTGNHWIVVDTNQIKAFDENWTLVLTSNDPVGDAGIAGTNHLGDPTFHDGEILIPLEAYPNAPYDNQHVAFYDPVDLSFIRSVDISAGGREASSCAVNPVDGFLYVTDFTDGGSIPYYNLETGALNGVLPLSQSLPKLQGIAWLGGRWYVSDDQNDRLWAIDPATGAVNTDPLYTSTRGGSFEGLAVKNGELHVLIDASPSAVYRLDPVNAGRETVSVSGAGRISYDAIPQQAAWTAAVTASTANLAYNNGILSVTADGDPSNRTTMLFRQSSDPDSINVWSNANGYMTPAAPIDPVLNRDYRLAFGYGAGARRQWVDGALYAAQSGVTHKPGTVMDVSLARKDPVAGTGAGGEALNGTLTGIFWLRGEVMSDDWMAADSANALSPSTFYTV